MEQSVERFTNIFKMLEMQIPKGQLNQYVGLSQKLVKKCIKNGKNSKLEFAGEIEIGFKVLKTIKPLNYIIIILTVYNKPEFYQIMADSLSNYEVLESKYLNEISNSSETQSEGKEIAVTDHPFSKATSSKWNLHFENRKLFNDISKDIPRVRRELMNFSTDNKQDILRFIFVFMKENKVKYSQNLIEIAVSLFYCIVCMNAFFGISNISNCKSISFDTLTTIIVAYDEFLDIENTSNLQKKFDSFLKKNNIRLLEFFQNENISLELVTSKWFLTLFLKISKISEIINIFMILVNFRWKPDIIFQIATNLLLQLKEKLENNKTINIYEYLDNISQLIEIDKAILFAIKAINNS